jgi:serine/threonine protein kinase
VTQSPAARAGSLSLVTKKMKDLTGPILQNYEEKELIASGSFSWVYRCLNQEEGSLCAIKIAKPSELCRKAVRQAANRRNALVYRTQLFEWGSEFLYETSLAPDFAPSDFLRRQAAILSACNDSSLVKFIESGVAEDQAYLCMDYLAGPTLRELLRCGKASIQTLIDVLEGLGRLYGSTSFQYHGDLKPENIIVTAAGAKMIDPGIFSGGALVTTQAYYPTLSPVDLVACGAMLWEIVLDCQPFTSWLWSGPNRNMGPRLARLEDLGHWRNLYYYGTDMYQSVRRPAQLVPGISAELEAFLLSVIGMELEADGRIEMGGEPDVPCTKECSEFLDELIRYRSELEDLRFATRIDQREYFYPFESKPAIPLPREMTFSSGPFTQSPHLSPPTPDQLGKYLLRKRIANGVFCKVYEALNTENGSVCAIKIGKPMDSVGGVPTRLWKAPTKEHHTKAEAFISGGTCEVKVSPAELLAKQAAHLGCWKDPGVVQLHEQGMREDTPYLCLDYLPGLTLRQLIRGKRADLQTLVEILEALDRLVARSPIKYHGDLKPENIIVTNTGAKMIDPGYFGQLDGDGDVMITTKAYYPRLQPNDIFACGLILWEIVLHYHPLLDYWTEFDSKTIGPELEDAISHAFVVERAYLENLATVTKPSLVNREITPTIEDFLLKAIGLQRLVDGRIDSGEGFKSFCELKDALIRYREDLEHLCAC